MLELCRFYAIQKTAIFIGYLNPLNARRNDDITHFPQWEYIADMQDGT